MSKDDVENKELFKDIDTKIFDSGTKLWILKEWNEEETKKQLPKLAVTKKTDLYHIMKYRVFEKEKQLSKSMPDNIKTHVIEEIQDDAIELLVDEYVIESPMATLHISDNDYKKFANWSNTNNVSDNLLVYNHHDCIKWINNNMSNVHGIFESSIGSVVTVTKHAKIKYTGKSKPLCKM